MPEKIRNLLLYRTPFKTHRDPDLRRRRKTKSGVPHSKVRSIAAVHACVADMSQERFLEKHFEKNRYGDQLALRTHEKRSVFGFCCGPRIKHLS